MGPLTKEKVLCGVALLASLLMLSSLRLPRAEAVPVVPPEEPARAYRVVAGAPLLAPEKVFGPGGRDPFQVQDAWGEAAPALLEVPPPVRWPRALPGGPSARPRTAAERRLLPGQPPAGAPAAPPGQGGGR